MSQKLSGRGDATAWSQGARQHTASTSVQALDNRASLLGCFEFGCSNLAWMHAGAVVMHQRSDMPRGHAVPAEGLSQDALGTQLLNAESKLKPSPHSRQVGEGLPGSF